MALWIKKASYTNVGCFFIGLLQSIRDYCDTLYYHECIINSLYTTYVSF